MIVRSFLMTIAALAIVGCAAEPDAEPGLTHGALTTEQCDYFDVNGKVTICHRTSSTKNPYVVVRVATEGCIEGHEDHVGDYVAPEGDTSCQQLGCYPQTAPCEPPRADGAYVVPCCEGLTCQDGYCESACPANAQELCEASGGTFVPPCDCNSR